MVLKLLRSEQKGSLPFGKCIADIGAREFPLLGRTISAPSVGSPFTAQLSYNVLKQGIITENSGKM
jgi:hypothetical protein